MSKGKWGQLSEVTTPCKRCGYPTTNSACMSCGSIRCEPCFQFTDACCSDMKMDNGRIPDMIHRGTLKLEKMVTHNPHLKTIQCLNKRCLTATKVSVYEDYPTTTGEYQFCPKCGSEAEVIAYLNRKEFYEMLACNLMLPVEIIEETYPLWDKEFKTFRAFVRHYIRELLKAES